MNTQPPRGFGAELRLILQRTLEVWRLIPAAHKRALIFAAILMALTSASNTAVALFLGHLVDGVTTGTTAGANPSHLYRLAATFLGLISAAYVLREALNVVRRYFV